MKRLNSAWWLKQRARVLERDGYRCCGCGVTEDLAVHHIVPFSEGGSDELANLESLCCECHLVKHPESWNRLMTEGRRRALVQRRGALAALYERFISALYGQENFPCDVMDGVLLVHHSSVAESIAVSPEPECSPWRVEPQPPMIAPEPKPEPALPLSRFPATPFVITHNLTPEEIAKAF